jgi:hypothetical protein
MDRDLSLNFIEENESEIEDICYHLSLACSSSLKTTKTSSSLVVMTYEGMSGTHDLREMPLVMIPHEDHSWLQVYEESLDMEDFDCALVLHCRYHEALLLAQCLATNEVVENVICRPTNKEVYAPVDWGTKYRTNVDTSLWDSGPIDISRLNDRVAHIGYRKVHDDTMVCSGLQQYTMVYDGMQWVFGKLPPGRCPDRDFHHIIDFGSLRIDEWMDEPHGEVYPSEIDI